VGKAGYLPKLMQRTNANGISIPILVLQGLIVTFLCLIFVVMPSVESVFQILSQISNIMFLTMYIVMFLAAIALRYSQPNIARPFRIPGGNFGMWLVGLVGLAGALISGALSFAPPTQIGTGNAAVYVGILLAATAVEVAIPFIVFACRKPEWKDANSDFEPFEKKAA
jgi:amino acid transporter